MGRKFEGGARLGVRAALAALFIGLALVMLVSVVGFMAMSFSKLTSAAHNSTIPSSATATPWLVH